MAKIVAARHSSYEHTAKHAQAVAQRNGVNCAGSCCGAMMHKPSGAGRI